MSVQTVNGSITSDQLNLLNILRKLWTNQAMWIRSFILSTAFETEDLRPVAVELIHSTVQLANVLRPFYGDEIANKLARLLSYHLFVAFQVIDALKRGYPRDIQEQRERWYNTADEIAQFLYEINPNWEKSELQKILYDSENMIVTEAILIFTNQFRESIGEYYSIQEEALKMADFMAYGLFQQFPALSQGLPTDFSF